MHQTIHRIIISGSRFLLHLSLSYARRLRALPPPHALPHFLFGSTRDASSAIRRVNPT